MATAVFAAACFLGQFLQTTIGFGLNVLVMAMAATFFPVTRLASVCSLLSLVSSAYFMFRWRRQLRPRLIVWPLVTMLTFSALAIRTIRYIPVRTLKGFLGAALLGLSIFLLASRDRLRVRASPGAGLAVGAVSGVLGGYFSTGGPPLVAYLLSASGGKEEYLAGIQTAFFVSNVWMVSFRAAEGYLDGGVLRLCLLGAAGDLHLHLRRQRGRQSGALLRRLCYGAKKGKKHLISTKFEHHAVLHTLAKLEKQGFEVTLLDVHEDGVVRLEEVEAAIRPDTALVTVMFANNEIGTIQPIGDRRSLPLQGRPLPHRRRAGHGPSPMNVQEMNIDMLSLSAHKFHGPRAWACSTPKRACRW
jgi:uncharacterized membrane protein YfcA